MTEIHPVRNVTIQGVSAKAFQRAPKEYTSVRDAEAADRVMADPGNTHHCPLCNQFFGTEALRAHAQGCINANAPRWERQRDTEPGYAKVKRFSRRLLIPGHSFKAKE